LPVVLVAFVLVLLAAASFAAGIAASRTSNTLVYLSIVFSLAAFVTLAIASIRARQAERAAADESLPATPARTLDETQAHAGPLLGGLDPTQLDMTPSWRRQSGRRVQPTEEAEEDDEEFDDELENEEDEADLEVPAAPVAAAPQVSEVVWGLDDEEEDEEYEDDLEPTAAYSPVDEFDEDDVLDIPEPEPEEVPSPEDAFYDEYDDLTAAEILPLLRDLDLDGLEWVRTRERSGGKRATVLNQVEQLIVEHGGRPAAKSRKRAAAKKAAPARRASKSTRRR
jgi:hypothetical protein